MRVMLVGTNHRHQVVGCSEGQSEAFSHFLRKVIRKCQIQTLAEELNEEAFATWGGHGSTARSLAESLGIQHIFCDPTAQERACIGISTTAQVKADLNLGKFLKSEQVEQLDAEQRKYWPQREAYWLTRLRSMGCNQCLFILGSDHVQSFMALLSAHHIQPVLVHENWEP